MIDPATADEIKSNIDIVEVLSDFLDLQKSGSTYKCLSPFSSEKTPSFTVFPKTNTFKDFSSGLQGDAITFLREHEGFTYPEALEYLAKKYNIPIQKLEVTDEQRQAYQENESMLIALAGASDYFQEKFQASEAQSYASTRGISEEMQSRFALGFAPDAWQHFNADHPEFSKEILLKAGLLSKKEGSGHTYEYFRNRLIFPIHSPTGKILGFGARTLDAKPPKYLNSPENAVYQKSKILYGFHLAKSAIREADCCYLVEGYTDVIALHQIGLENTVASCGTGLSLDQLRLMARFTGNIVLLRDGDQAGRQATLSQINLILIAGLNISVVELPEKEDPDSYASKLGEKAFKEYLTDHQKDFVTYILDHLPRSNPAEKARAIRKIAHSIALISDQTHQKLLARKASLLLTETTGFINTEISKAKREIEKTEREKQSASKKKNNEAPSFFSIQKGKYGWDIHIDEQLFISFLGDQGFRVFERGDEISLLRIQKNVLSKVTIKYIKDFIKEYISGLPEIISRKTIPAGTEYDISETITKKRNDLLRTFIRQGENLINENKLCWLDTFEGEMLRDTKDTSYFLFKNGYVEVKLARLHPEDEIDHEVEIKLKKYEELSKLNKYVWKQHIKDFEVSILEGKDLLNFSFLTFLFNQSKQNTERLKSLLAVLGYLLHRYKSPSYPRVPIITDEGVSFGEEGGSGKGLLFKALGHLRNVCRIDGKKFKTSNEFVFQDVSPETRIVYLDDVKPNFDFKFIFSDVTEGITVNPKGRPQFQLPFEDSPKFAILTNYIIEGESGSFKRRVIELEIHQHYSDKYEPVRDFGKQFFQDWTQEEWNQFYNLAFYAVGRYFKFFDKSYIPRITTAGINIAYKKFLQKTARLLKVPRTQKEFLPEYAKWLSENLEPGSKQVKKDLFQKFVDQYEDFKEAKLQQSAFTKWIMDFAKFQGWGVETSRSNGMDYIEFKSEENQDALQQKIGRFQSGGIPTHEMPF